MIEIEWDHKSLTATDVENREVTVGIDGEVAPDSEDCIDRPIDACVSGTGRQLTFPMAGVCIDNQYQERWYRLEAKTKHKEIPEGNNIIHIESAVKIYLFFEGSAFVRERDDDILIEFPDHRHYFLGFRTNRAYPMVSITVSGDIQDIAKGVSYLSSSIQTTTPDRTFPSLRGPPPRLELGTHTEIPNRVRSAKQDTGIRFRIPNLLEYLFVISPLAYFLQADILPENRNIPILHVDGWGDLHVFDKFPRFQSEVQTLLSKIFYAEVLFREGGPHAVGLCEASEIKRDELEKAYQYSIRNRVGEILTGSFDKYLDISPNWNLTSYLEPIPDNIELLPYLLSDLSTIFISKYCNIKTPDSIERILGENKRGKEIPTTEQSVATLSNSKFHAWIADGLPFNTFEPSLESYGNQNNYIHETSSTTRILIIINDFDMVEESKSIERIYQSRGEKINLNVEIQNAVSQDRLIDLLASTQEFVHFIGHSTEKGLLCTDGYLDISDIPLSRARTFFLNSCSSIAQGRKLIKAGSVAGIVTTKPVMNKPATEIGSITAELLANGFNIEWAKQIANYQTVTDHGYVVIGDGTYIVAQPEIAQPMLCLVETIARDDFMLMLDAGSPRHPGACYEVRGIPRVDASPALIGNDTVHRVSGIQLDKFLNNVEIPVLFDGEYYWSDDARDRIIEHN